jgi:SAM-dependent methyltransferase
VKDVPAEYYRRLAENEVAHWWSRGMRSIMAAFLEPIIAGRTGLRLLDAGCGTGGFLAWAAENGAFSRLVGVDVSPEAIAIAGRDIPRVELHVASLSRIPLESESFDVVVANDVLQHVHEHEVGRALAEMRRVLAPGGVVLVRTNGGRVARRERNDWRLYDAPSLRRDLEQAGLWIERVTYVNLLPSLWGALRGNAPTAPTDERAGIPASAGTLTGAVGRAVLSAEARYLRKPGRRLPYGHTLLALAHRADGNDSG